MTFFLCTLLWVLCIGLMCWADLSAQNHIQKGWDAT